VTTRFNRAIMRGSMPVPEVRPDVAEKTSEDEQRRERAQRRLDQRGIGRETGRHRDARAMAEEVSMKCDAALNVEGEVRGAMVRAITARAR